MISQLTLSATLGAEVYRWKGDRLTEVMILEPRTDSQRRTVNPLVEETGIFLEFADLSPTKESVLHFANRYGSVSAYLDEWEKSIRLMKAAIDSWLSGDLQGVAVNDPQRGIERSFGGVHLHFDYERLTTYLSTARVMEVMRFQLFTAASMNATPRNCQVCGSPFVVFPPMRRSTRLYCSRACNTAAYRERQASAKENDNVATSKRSKKKKGMGRGRSQADK